MRDEGRHAKSLKRVGVQQLLTLGNASDVDAVIVHKLDRLTQSVVDLDKIIKLLDRNGVVLVSMHESLDVPSRLI